MSDTASAPDPLSPPRRPGLALARGVCRLLVSHGFMPLTEYVPAPGLRVDVMAIGSKGEIWVVECKSGLADFTADHKWQGYLQWCDRYFWAVDTGFPVDVLPEGTGLIVADAWGGEILRHPPETRLAGARRAAVTRGFARAAARGLLALRDPGGSGGQG